MSNSKKDRLSQKQPETVNGVGGGLQIAAANAGESSGAFNGSGDRNKNSGKNKGKNKK